MDSGAHMHVCVTELVLEYAVFSFLTVIYTRELRAPVGVGNRSRSPIKQQQHTYIMYAH
jgi:hypothetical protein